MPITHTAGLNMPGYLPEGDVFEAESFESAKVFMLQEMEREADGQAECGYDDLADEIAAAMEDLNLESGPEWSTTIGNTAYWITLAEGD